MFKSGLLLTGAMMVAHAPAVGQAPASPANMEDVVDLYPAKSRKLREEGTVHYQVEVNSRGELESCAVTRSSGFSRLDAATCLLLVQRARFERKGERYTYNGTVVWKL